MSDPAVLSPTHAALVEAARQRADHRLVPPERVRGAARRRLAEKLVALGLAELVRDPDAPWWVDPNHGPTGLRLGPGERGGDPAAPTVHRAEGGPEMDRDPLDRDPFADPAASLVLRSPAEPAPSGGAASALVVTPSPTEPRSWTKIARVLALLRRPEGADLATLVAVTGWLPHTARAALTGLRRKGHAIDAGREDGRTVYRIGAESDPMTEADAKPDTAAPAATAR